jgi:hypothetical protein
MLYAPIALIPEIKGNKRYVWLVNDLPNDAEVLVEIKKNGKLIFLKKVRAKGNSLKKLLQLKESKSAVESFVLSMYEGGRMVFSRLLD